MTPTFAELILMFPLFVNITQAPQPPKMYMSMTVNYPIVSNLSVEYGADDENKDEYEIFDGDDDIEPLEKKTIYTMTESELNALSLSQKAKLLHMNKKTFKTFVKLVNREAGPKMQDKILVAAVVWNRKYCKQYPDTVKKVMYDPGQFVLRGQKKTEIHGDYKDKKAQLAILLAYRQVHNNQIPHNVQYFNNISYRMGNPDRFKRYKHYNNYFVKDTRCKCKWCAECS